MMQLRKRFPIFLILLLCLGLLSACGPKSPKSTKIDPEAGPRNAILQYPYFYDTEITTEEYETGTTEVITGILPSPGEVLTAGNFDQGRMSPYHFQYLVAQTETIYIKSFFSLESGDEPEVYRGSTVSFLWEDGTESEPINVGRFDPWSLIEDVSAALVTAYEKESVKIHTRTIRELYDELMAFKDTEEFHLVGFATDTPYWAWLQKVLEKRESPLYTLKEKTSLGYLKSLGYYLRYRKGEMDGYTNELTNKIKNVYPCTSCGSS